MLETEGKSYKLLSYKRKNQLNALNKDSSTYILKVEIYRFWGLLNKTIEIEQELPDGMNPDFWEDKLNVWLKD